MRREKMIEEMIQDDINSMDIEALINYFYISSLEYFEDLSDKDVEEAYNAFINDRKEN